MPFLPKLFCYTGSSQEIVNRDHAGYPAKSLPSAILVSPIINKGVFISFFKLSFILHNTTGILIVTVPSYHTSSMPQVGLRSIFNVLTMFCILRCCE